MLVGAELVLFSKHSERMHHGFENGRPVPVHIDELSEDVDDTTQARDIAQAGFVGMMDWVRGNYASEKHTAIRYRTLASSWVTDPTLFRKYKQKEFAKRHGLNPQSFCRSVANFSKRFGIINERMKPRQDRSTYTYGGRVLPANPRKRVM